MVKLRQLHLYGYIFSTLSINILQFMPHNMKSSNGLFCIVIDTQIALVDLSHGESFHLDNVVSRVNGRYFIEKRII